MSSIVKPLFSDRFRVMLALALMLFGVLAVYSPSEYESGKVALVGEDHICIHMRRIAFAQEALLGGGPSLPGWYPRELMGTPFWSNIQSFPFLPTRLAVLLLVDPFNALTVGAILAALLAATFTFLFCRNLGFAPVSAAAAGWTFSCGGFFASRLLAGHLPLLEAYPSLPFLLWLAERALQARDRSPLFARRLLLLGIGCGCVALAGHPQLPFYSMATTAIYILCRDRGKSGFIGVAAMGAGTFLAAFALWPMAMLTGRSTRVLALDRAANDIAFPYGRLSSFFFPWIDGVPANLNPGHSHPLFSGYPNNAYFWDTVCYVGWLPWVALLLLIAIRIRRGKHPGPPWMFFAVMGAAALLFALPAWQQFMSHIPGTFLRSPARQIYLTTFALAIVMGAAVESLIRLAPRTSRPVLFAGLALALGMHAVDLWTHDRAFVVTARNIEAMGTDAGPALTQLVGDGRVAMDYRFATKWNRHFDDVGFFDSIMLARPYRGLLAMDRAAPGLNVQTLNGSELNARTLAACGVHLVATNIRRADLHDLTPNEPDGLYHMYSIPDPAPRAAFFGEAAVQILPLGRIHETLRSEGFDFSRTLLLRNDENPPSGEKAPSIPEPVKVSYERPSPDLIELSVNAPVAGWVRVLESWDRGWSAEVDGAAAPIVAANDMFLAVRVAPGAHRIRMKFATPGAVTGVAVSLCGLLALLGLARWVSKRVWRGESTAPEF